MIYQTQLKIKQTVFRSLLNVSVRQNLVNSKDKIGNLNKNGMYKLHYASCDAKCVERTYRSLKTRIEVHLENKDNNVPLVTTLFSRVKSFHHKAIPRFPNRKNCQTRADERTRNIERK